MLVWRASSEGDIPEPQPGLDEIFDKANNRVIEIKGRLDELLQKVREQFGVCGEESRINWSHAKYRYELEIPIELVEGGKKPEDFEFTSQKKDYQRFHTKDIKKLVDKLEVAEDMLKDAFTPFLCSLFAKFHEKKFVWDAVLNLLAELDCLASLSIVSG